VNQPGIIVLLGSGETSSAGGQAFELVANRVKGPLNIRILETPAGFELNANRVAGRVADFLNVRLQNYHPNVQLVPARRRGTPNSPDAPDAIAALLDSQIIFMGPGSPSYAVRQLQGSLAWDYVQILHRLGAALVLASAATISIGHKALPVYEIYKVGEDPHWKAGLDFLRPYGLSLIYIPHWNNAEGGAELDTSRCFIGRERFDELCRPLPEGTNMVGLDEHTGLIIDLQNEQCEVIGHSQVHLVKDCEAQDFNSGERFDIRLLGDFAPLQDLQSGIAAETWQKVVAERQALLAAEMVPDPATATVQELANLRQTARQNKNWKESDMLRDQILALGWKVIDTPQGARLERS